MRKRLRRLVLLWHRWLGLLSVPFVILLVITGVLLLRTDSLELDRRYLTHDWLLTWYGVAPTADPISYAAGDVWLSSLGGTLYLDGTPIQQPIETFGGAVALGPAIVAAADGAVLLFTEDGELVEKVTPVGVGGPITALAAGANDTLLVRSSKGAFRTDLDMVVWQPVVDDNIVWSTSGDVPADIRGAIMNNYRGTGLPWERVLLDLHSGRLFGPFGPYLMDGAALLLLLLSATGVYNWVRRR